MAESKHEILRPIGLSSDAVPSGAAEATTGAECFRAAKPRVPPSTQRFHPTWSSHERAL